VLKLALFVLPLGLDTFAVSAAFGLRGLPRSERLKVSVLMSSFEMAMPVVGLLLGTALGHAVGGVAKYVAAAALVALGGWMLFGGEHESDGAAALSSRGVLALVGLGISISLDELAIGFTIGLLRLSIVLAVILIGAQAFVFAQLGLRLGALAGDAAREWAERIAAVALWAIAALVLVEKLA
jgi:putative Mn2+ efflux pump MntP